MSEEHRMETKIYAIVGTVLGSILSIIAVNYFRTGDFISGAVVLLFFAIPALGAGILSFYGWLTGR